MDSSGYNRCFRLLESVSSEGFVHESINHSKNLVDPDSHAHTQNIESTWREVRAEIHVSGGKKNTWWVTWPNFSSNENILIIGSGFTLSSQWLANSIPLLPSSLIKRGFPYCWSLFFRFSWLRIEILVCGYVPTSFCFVVCFG